MKAKNHSESTKQPERITPVQPPAHKAIGFNTSIVEQAIVAGPAGLRQAQRIALRYARRYQEEAADSWKLETEWLKSFDAVHRSRARYARVWRPRFLAALSMTNSVTLAARRARISRQAIYEHRKRDAEFSKQWDEAVEHAIDMLHARAFQRALEGDLEPVWFMGKPVGYVRKFDSKLQIELLRAHLPQKFKTPGTNVNVGTRSDVFVLTEEQRAHLKALNRKWLDSAPLSPRPFASDAGERALPALGAPPGSAQGEERGDEHQARAGIGCACSTKAEAHTPPSGRTRTTAGARRNSLG